MKGIRKLCSALRSRLDNQRGTVIVLVGVGMFIFLGVAALAIDLGYLYVVRNELQNAADAGALAGARVLYNDDGTLVNVGANQVACDAATANRSANDPVEVNWTSGSNAGDVQRGHWSFATRTFTANPSTAPVDLWNVPWDVLDADVNFINAIRVVARRDANPVGLFFARIFGQQDARLSATAVAYIGFAGTLTPFDVDQPIAICRQAILDPNGNYTCGVGRMINSGSNIGHQTGGWTNFSQEPCDTASVPTVRPLVCGEGNPEPIKLGDPMGTTGGELQTAFDQMIDCWRTHADTDHDGVPDQPWQLTLPVIDCPGNNVGPCSNPTGAVTVNIVWITRTDKNQMNEVPRRMGNWTCPSGNTPQQCWGSFVDNFQLKDVLNNSGATYEDKTIYFLPDCTPHEPAGTSGGENYGILAEIPVLVR